MKKTDIKTRHVYFNNQINTLFKKDETDVWSPINFQWIPLIKFNQELN
jgi:hypothetical protein